VVLVDKLLRSVCNWDISLFILVILEVLVISYTFKFVISFLFWSIYASSTINFELIVDILFVFYVIFDLFTSLSLCDAVILFVFEIILFLFNTLSDCNNDIFSVFIVILFLFSVIYVSSVVNLLLFDNIYELID